MRIHFVFLGEGTSDAGLIPHLEMLCIEAGAEEVTGTALDFGRLPSSIGHSVADKVRATMLLEPNANLYFIHRDADSPDSSPRHNEIDEATRSCDLKIVHVSVVPVQETEAWLLLDEEAIRLVAGKPNGRASLNLPAPESIETVSRPKEYLQEALIKASEYSGRRLEKFRAQFPTHRTLLLQRLPTAGTLSQLPAWRRMRDDTREALNSIRKREAND